MATFFYLGMIPVAPGTFGTLGAMTVYGVLLYCQSATLMVLAVFLGLACVVNLFIGKWAEEYFGRKDPHQVVIDEVAGYFVTVLFFQPSGTVAVGAFVLFRLFDISKIYPMKTIEKYPHAKGILLDDLVAGVYAAVSLGILGYFLQMIGCPVDIQGRWS